MPSRERRLNEESNTNAKENKNLKNLNVSKTAQYKSPEVVAELLDLMSIETQNNVLDEMRNSPTYSLMVDVVMDIASHKHLAICARYIGPDSKIKNVIVSDSRIPDGRAETITDTIKNELSKSNLNINDMLSFGSDGAAVLSGNTNGVWTKLKNENSSLITNHCKDHRLALACKDSYKSVKTMKRLDDMLDNVHKYYKYSANRTKTLENVQKALDQPVLKVKKAKHHRWLSHGKAVKSIVESYK